MQLSLSPEYADQIDGTVEFLQGEFSLRPRIGIILGTGAGEIANTIQVDCEIPYDEIPGFPMATALGHAGQLVLGKLGGTSVLTMQGRFHLYEGYSFEGATYPIQVMHRLGIETLIVTNASGGLNPKFRSGDIMLMESHLDMTWRVPGPLRYPEAAIRVRNRVDTYDRPLMDNALETARRHGFPLHQGVYAALLGPNYETRAEYRMLARIGADAAGMSTVPELTVANYLGMKAIGFSVIANLAKPDVLKPTSGQEVIDAAIVAAPHLLTLVENLCQQE